MKIKKSILKLIILLVASLFLISILSISSIADQEIGKKGENDPSGNSNNDPQSEPNVLNSGEQINNNPSGQQTQEKNQNKNQGQDGGKNQQQYQKGKNDNDGDHIDDERERHQNRYMHMTCEKNRTQIRSEWQYNNTGDAFEVSFDVENEPRIYFDYIPDVNTSEIKLSFNLSIKRLFEYQDINVNGRYNKNDIIESVYLLENINFTEIIYSNETSLDGEEITVISTGTEDGVFSIILYVVDNFSQINNRVLSPSEIKMDFIINNYPFVYDHTLIAIQIDLETEHETEIETVSFDEKQGYSKNESEINISSFNYNGFFSWADYVLVDNEIRPVNVTIRSEKEETIFGNDTIISKIKNVYFSYPQGVNILHDPEVGVVSFSYKSFAESSVVNDITLIIKTIFTDILVFIVICLFAGILFFGVIFFRKRMFG